METIIALGLALIAVVAALFGFRKSVKDTTNAKRDLEDKEREHKAREDRARIEAELDGSDPDAVADELRRNTRPPIVRRVGVDPGQRR